MKRESVLLLMAIHLFGCTDTAALLSKGDLLTSGTMVSAKSLTTAADGSYKDEEAEALLNETFRLYEVNQTAAGDQWKTDVVEAKLSSITVKPERDSFLQISGKQYFAATSNPDLAYGALLISANLKYEHMMELQLMEKNPQFRLKYNLNPYELLKYQLKSGANERIIFLFQSYVSAPEVVIKHTLVETTARADFPVLFQGSHATIKNKQESFGRRFVFRRYKNADIVSRLVDGRDPMFEESASVDSVSNGQKNVAPQLLTIKLGEKKYKLSREYALHLTNENVWFDVPNEPSHDPLAYGGVHHIRVNDKPIFIPVRK